jgi:hypothetical protein
MRCRLWRNRILKKSFAAVLRSLVLHLKHTQSGARWSPRKPRRVSRGTAFAVQHDGMDRLVLEPLFIPSVQSHQEGALRVATSNFFSTPTEKGSSYLQHHRVWSFAECDNLRLLVPFGTSFTPKSDRGAGRAEESPKRIWFFFFSKINSFYWQKFVHVFDLSFRVRAAADVLKHFLWACDLLGVDIEQNLWGRVQNSCG